MMGIDFSVKDLIEFYLTSDSKIEKINWKSRILSKVQDKFFKNAFVTDVDIDTDGITVHVTYEQAIEPKIESINVDLAIER